MYPAGLYVSNIDRESNKPFEDECTLVLPFGISTNGFARTSDGARFGEDTEGDEVEPKSTNADLYQSGYQPFGETHGVRIVNVFRSWLGMVGRGDWTVNEDGVVGDTTQWRDADTSEHWQKFVVPVGW